jgi:predicted dehydrogenase
MLQAAIIGLGYWGQTLVNAAQGSSAAIHFVAGATRTPGAAAEFAARQGIAMYGSLEEVLARPEVEAVVLATPHSAHLPQILLAARAGKHIFVEKPLTLTRAEAEQAFAATDAADVRLCVGHNRRFLPSYAALAELAAKELGEVLQITGNISTSIGGYKPGAWRASPAESPAGGMTSLGIHMVDTMVGLGVRATRVSVTTRRRAGSTRDDTLTALIDWRDGSLGVLTTMISTARAWRMEIFGSRGWAAMDGETRLVHAPIGQAVRSWDFPYCSMERAELESFAAAVAGSARYPVLAEQAIHGIAIFEAICAAAASGPVWVESRDVV